MLVYRDLVPFDSTQILEYLEDLKHTPRLWPVDVASRAHARLLEQQSDEVYFPHILRLMGLQLKGGDALALSSIAAAHVFDAKLEPLRTDQDDVTGSFSFADIARNMALLFGALRGADLGENTPHLLASRGLMSTPSGQAGRPADG